MKVCIEMRYPAPSAQKMQELEEFLERIEQIVEAYPVTISGLAFIVQPNVNLKIDGAEFEITLELKYKGYGEADHRDDPVYQQMVREGSHQ